LKTFFLLSFLLIILNCKSVYDRFLTFAKPKIESDGVLLCVPNTLSQGKLLKWKDQLEKISGILIEVSTFKQKAVLSEESLPSQQHHQWLCPSSRSPEARN